MAKINQEREIVNLYLMEKEQCFPVEWFNHSVDYLREGEFICEVCKGVYRDPQSNNHGDVIGKYCVDKIDITFRSDFRTRNQTMKLQIHCPKECAWVGTLEHLYIHIQNDCTKTFITCGNEGCGETFSRFKQTEHDEKCKFIKLDCPFKMILDCNEQPQKIDLLKHLTSESHYSTLQKKLSNMLDEKYVYQVFNPNHQYNILNKCHKCSGKLRLVPMSIERPRAKEHICDLCRQNSNGAYSCRCDRCDFDVCLTCDQQNKQFCPGCKKNGLTQKTGISVQSQKDLIFAMVVNFYAAKCVDPYYVDDYVYFGLRTLIIQKKIFYDYNNSAQLFLQCLMTQFAEIIDPQQIFLEDYCFEQDTIKDDTKQGLNFDPFHKQPQKVGSDKRVSVSSSTMGKRVSFTTHDQSDGTKRASLTSEQSLFFQKDSIQPIIKGVEKNSDFRDFEQFSDIIQEDIASEKSEDPQSFQNIVEEPRRRSNTNVQKKKNRKKKGNIDETKVKTEMCKNWSETGKCSYGKKCKFAHGLQELVTKDKLEDNSKYRSKPCNQFVTHQCCSYGPRCQFIHENRQVDEIKSQYKYQNILNEVQGDIVENSSTIMQNHDIMSYCGYFEQQKSQCLPLIDDKKRRKSKSLDQYILQLWVEEELIKRVQRKASLKFHANLQKESDQEQQNS